MLGDCLISLKAVEPPFIRTRSSLLKKLLLIGHRHIILVSCKFQLYLGVVMASRVSNVPSASEIPEDLLDPVNYEPMLDAVSLVPCGHTFSEKTAAELMNRRMVCPLGREDIQGHTPNYIVRNLASKAINKSEVNQAAAHKEGPSAKAVTHLERGKELYTQEKYEEAILAFIAALSPTETYQGQGWGLLQVLQGISSSSKNIVDDFVDSAKKVLAQRVKNAPPGKHEEKWLKGWFNRLETYL